MQRTGLLIFAVLLVCGGALKAQGLTGVFTCSNGNPGSSFDYGDIGTFFAAVETQGLAGPVTLEVYDGGGTFTSGPEYGLGLTTGGSQILIPGISAANTVTVRAAPNNFPVVQGSGGYDVGFGGVSATIAVRTSHVRIEGIEAVGGTHGGIYVYGNPLADIVIRRCRVHGVTIGPGIVLYNDLNLNLENCIIENNAIWNCKGGAGPFGSFIIGALAIRRAAPTTVIRHNTVIHNSGAAGSSAFGYLGGSNGVNTFTFEGNIFYNSTSGTPVLNITTGFDPVAPDYNFYYATNGATFHANTASFANFAAWQTSGRDSGGSSADPGLTSAALGTENFQLTPASAAIDAAITSNIADDIDGNQRPFGAAADSGCSEFTGPPPDMSVDFNSVAVTPAGQVNVGTSRTVVGDSFTFNVANAGPGDLQLFGNPPVSVSMLSNCEPSTDISAQPAQTTIAPSASTTFTVFIEPTAVGPFSLLVSIPNSDPAKNPFEFTIQGDGILPNAPAFADLAAGSALSGSPFSVAYDPGASLANVTIELLDPESDNITITAIDPPLVVPTGIVAPSIPGTPGHPVLLEWTGTADASNDPGDYTWTVHFEDAVNGTSVQAEVTITINDLPPVRAIAGADSGSGTAADPYFTTFTQGDDGSASVDMASVSDPNTSQALNVVNISQGANPTGGVGFQINFNAGIVSLAPNGSLSFDDAGTHTFTVQIGDGTNIVGIVLAALVYSTSGAITFDTPNPLPDGEVNQPYNLNIQVSGATAPTFNLQSGSLPTGVTLSAAGVISGTPLATGVFTFTVRVLDGIDTATQQYDLEIKTAPPPPTGGSSGSSGGGGCAAAAGGGWLGLILLSTVAWRRRRTR